TPVFAAKTGHAARQLNTGSDNMLGMPIDLVMLDLDLADAEGFSAVEQACAAHPGVPVVVVSGRAGPGVAARVIAHGAAGFVPKSASAATVMEAVRAVRA